MKLNDKVSTAWSNLGRRKVRTALTSMGVVVGITTIVTLISLVNGVQFQVHAQFAKLGLDRVVVQPRNSGGFGGDLDLFGGGQTATIGQDAIERWKKWPEVKSAVPVIRLPPTVSSRLELEGKAQKVRVTDVNSLSSNPFASLIGEDISAVEGTLEMPEGAKGLLIVGTGLLSKLGIAPKSALGQTAKVSLRTSRGEHQDYNLKIVGVSSQGGSEVQVSTLDCLSMKSWWFNDPNVLKEGGYDTVMLRTDNVTQARSVVTKLRAEKRYQVQSIDQLLAVADRIFQVITGMLLMVSSVTFFVACIGIINTMIMAIYERTREIGTLKAMGASKGDIRLMFMAEAGFIGLIGGVAGLFLGWLVGRALTGIGNFIAKQSDLPSADLFLITAPLAIGALFFATLIGILAGLYPANRAAGLDPLVALRHE